MVWPRRCNYQYKRAGQEARLSTKLIAELPSHAFFFPEDLVIEILTFLEPKSLLRCKSVCKQWYAIIQHRYFAERRMKCNRGQLHYVKSHGSPVQVDEFIRPRPKVFISYCDGLLLQKTSIAYISEPSYTHRANDSYEVINPCTKQVLDIPGQDWQILDMGIYLQSSIGSYKVVAIYIEKKEKNINFGVFDLGRGCNEDVSWRTLNISIFYGCSRDKLDYFRLKKSANGVVHFCKMISFGSSNAEIISVDLKKEASATCVVPRSFFPNWEDVTFVMLNDQPSLFSIVEYKLNIWTLKDYKKQKWTKLMISLPYWKRYQNMDMCRVTVCRFGGKDFLLYTDNAICFVYNVVSNTWAATSLSELETLKLPDNFVTLGGARWENEDWKQ